MSLLRDFFRTEGKTPDPLVKADPINESLLTTYIPVLHAMNMFVLPTAFIYFIMVINRTYCYLYLSRTSAFIR